MSSVTALLVVDLRDDPGQLRWKLRETAHEVGLAGRTAGIAPDHR